MINFIRNLGSAPIEKIQYVFKNGDLYGNTAEFSKNYSDTTLTTATSPNLSVSATDYFRNGAIFIPIDVTKYKKLVFKVASCSWYNEGKAGYGYAKSKGNANSGLSLFTAYKTATGQNEFDVSALTGIIYVALYAGSGNRNNGSVSVSEVWLEK